MSQFKFSCPHCEEHLQCSFTQEYAYTDEGTHAFAYETG
jgi:hypothetical protein